MVVIRVGTRLCHFMQFLNISANFFIFLPSRGRSYVPTSWIWTKINDLHIINRIRWKWQYMTPGDKSHKAKQFSPCWNTSTGSSEPPCNKPRCPMVTMLWERPNKPKQRDLKERARKFTRLQLFSFWLVEMCVLQGLSTLADGNTNHFQLYVSISRCLAYCFLVPGLIEFQSSLHRSIISQRTRGKLHLGRQTPLCATSSFLISSPWLSSIPISVSSIQWNYWSLFKFPPCLPSR